MTFYYTVPLDSLFFYINSYFGIDNRMINFVALPFQMLLRYSRMELSEKGAAPSRALSSTENTPPPHALMPFASRFSGLRAKPVADAWP